MRIPPQDQREPGTLWTEQVGGCLLICSADEPTEGPAALAAALPWEPDGHVVLVATAIRDERLWQHLRVVVASLVEQGSARVRLVASLTKAALARLQSIADTFAVEVIAPSGPMVMLPGGMCFVASEAGWHCLRPQMEPLPLGPRYPRPDWDSGTDLTGVASATVSVQSVPAGLLLRPAGNAPVAADDLAYAVPPDPARLSLLLGRLGDIPLALDKIADVVALLPTQLRSSLRLVPYGREAFLPARLLAREFDVDVLACAGLPVRARDGSEQVVVPADAEQAAHRPVVRALRFPAGGAGPEVVDHLVPTGWLQPRAEGGYRLSEQFAVLIVPAGLAVLSDKAAGNEAVVEALDRVPAHGGETAVLLGEPGQLVVNQVWILLSRLLTQLRPHTGGALRVCCLGLLDAASRAASAAIAQAHGIAFDVIDVPVLVAEPRLHHEHVIVAARPDSESTTQGTPVHQPEPVDSEPVGSPDPAATPDPAGQAPADPPSVAPQVVARPAAPPRPLPTMSTTSPTSPTATPVRPSTAEPPEPVVVEPLADRHSTPAERAAFARAAGAHYETASARVRAVMAVTPALRARDAEATKDDCVAVAIHLADEASDGFGLDRVAAKLRGSDDSLPDGYLACLMSGTRRLPSYRGAAFLGSDPQARVDAYAEGMSLLEPGFLTGSANADVAFDAPVEYAVWCTHAYRPGQLAPAPLPTEVLLPAGTWFRVVGLRPGRVLLRQVTVRAEPDPVTALDDTDLRVADALSHLLDAKDQLDDLVRPSAAHRSRCRIGLSPDGARYRTR
nr:hypothetical protein [Kibdelosporangium sp. MJ126-NF4]